MARSLSKQKNNTIGVILPQIEHPYFAKVLSRLEREAAKQGYRIMLFVSRNKEEREEQCIEMCKSVRVAGLVLCSGSFETEKFRGLDFPLITLERSMDEGTSGVECDNYQGGVMATQLLIDKGCHKLMYIGGMSAGEDIHMPADFREVAFRDTCAKTKMENLARKELYTLPIATQAFYGTYSTDLGLVMAALLLAMLPILVLYLFLQRYIVEGVTSGAVKG